MPKCPKCKTEYEEGAAVCPECGAALPGQQNKLALLTTVESETAFRIIEAKLAQYDIPALMKHKTFGDFMQVLSGTTMYGIDVYVPEPALSLAQSVINEDPG